MKHSHNPLRLLLHIRKLKPVVNDPADVTRKTEEKDQKPRKATTKLILLDPRIKSLDLKEMDEESRK